MKGIIVIILVLTFTSTALANYRCYNWQVESIGKEANGTEFFYVNKGICKKYETGSNPFDGPIVEKKTPFFKIVFRNGPLDKHIKRKILPRSDVYQRFLEFDLSDGCFANSPDELGIDLSTKSILMINLLSSQINSSKIN